MPEDKMLPPPRGSRAPRAPRLDSDEPWSDAPTKTLRKAGTKKQTPARRSVRITPAPTAKKVVPTKKAAAQKKAAKKPTSVDGKAAQVQKQPTQPTSPRKAASRANPAVPAEVPQAGDGEAERAMSPPRPAPTSLPPPGEPPSPWNDLPSRLEAQRLAPESPGYHPQVPGTAASLRRSPASCSMRRRAPVDEDPKRPGIPTSFGSRAWWFAEGLASQPAAVFVALLCAWTGVIVAIWAATLGLILGVLVAVGVIAVNSLTRSLFHAGAGEAVTFVSVATGALAGAGGSFVAVFTHEVFGNPTDVLIALLSGAVLAALVVVVIASAEGQFMAWRGYRPLTKLETRRLSPLVQQLAEEMNLSEIPRLAIWKNPVAGAWTHMRHVVLTTELLELLDDSELAAVLGHEFHHWADGDSVAQHFVWASAFPLVVFYNLAKRASGFQIEVAIRGQSFGRRLLPFLAWLVAWPCGLLINFVIVPTAAATMRHNEFEADAAVAAIGRGPAMVAALTKLSIMEPGRTGWETALRGTHPQTELRIERLVPDEPGDEDYKEGSLGINPVAARAWGMAALLVIAAIIVGGAFVNNSRHLIPGLTPTASTSGATGSGSTPQQPSSASAGGTPAPASSASAPQPSGNSGSSGTTPTTGPTTPTIPISAADASSAESTVVTFVTSYFDSLPNGYNDVIAKYGDPLQVSGLQFAATTNIETSGFSIASSRAQVIGCAYQASPPAVALRIEWTYTNPNGNSSGPFYFSDPITLSSLGGQWKAEAIATLPNTSASDISAPTLPAGFSACP